MTTYQGLPTNLASLHTRIRNLEADEQAANRRQIAMALVVISQMLPAGVVKGGSAMALRYGLNTRFTQDIDAARRKSLEDFEDDFEEALQEGWQGFTGRLKRLNAPSPEGIPTPYVMQPYKVSLDFKGKSWKSVTFELGHNEIGDVDYPDSRMPEDISKLFLDLGFQAPAPASVMAIDHQIAQKLHACSAAESDRAHDLVDLQLMIKNEQVDYLKIAATCRKLFIYRQDHSWPPHIEGKEEWDVIYERARENVDGLLPLEEAIAWVNRLISRIDSYK
ncbi:nucleotidyl transferase AbiEii/AbiGii toxin family protein [Corynebacterium sp. A21]|uniref:nucleotidyl transferase AbiEii/AbiGii toxin family protein n=1 Tax=Corynebacterium sp. A21 TaxID=3457318 RepID=UPI003FD405A2